MQENPSCWAQAQRWKGRRCSKQQSRNSPAAHGEDHGGAGCSPAAHRGPQWSRSSRCSVWKTPWVLQLLSLLPGLQLTVVKHQTSVSTHHNKFWLYFFPDYRIHFFHILFSFSLVERIRNTGILCSHRHFYRNKCLYNFCIHKLIIGTQAHFQTAELSSSSSMLLLSTKNDHAVYKKISILTKPSF